VAFPLVSTHLVIVLNFLVTLTHLELKHLAQFSAHFGVRHLHLRNVIAKGTLASSVGVFD
jgi:hypothetical protein